MKIRGLLLTLLLAAPLLPLAEAGCGSSSATGSGDDAGGGGQADTGGGTGDDDGSVAGDDSGAITDSGGKKDTGGGDAFTWPDCLTQPSAAPTKAISQIWSDNPSQPSEVWIAGAYVTAISHGGCTAGQACQIFLQSDVTYGSLGAGAHHAIKLFASAATANHFIGLQVGDQVNALGYAWRYNLGGQNELLVEVNASLPGCAHKVGTGTPTPIQGVALTDLTLAGYEQTYGPLLVQVAGVSGTPASDLTTTFGLYPTADAGGFFEAGAELVSLSPYFLPNGVFSNPPLSASKKTFTSVTGVFGVFLPGTDAGPVVKYLEIYPRTNADIVTP